MTDCPTYSYSSYYSVPVFIVYLIYYMYMYSHYYVLMYMYLILLLCPDDFMYFILYP